MVIQLVKEVSWDTVTYYVLVDGKMKAGSVCNNIIEAMQAYESAKQEGGKKVEIVMQETI